MENSANIKTTKFNNIKGVSFTTLSHFPNLKNNTHKQIAEDCDYICKNFKRVIGEEGEMAERNCPSSNASTSCTSHKIIKEYKTIGTFSIATKKVILGTVRCPQGRIIGYVKNGKVIRIIRGVNNGSELVEKLRKAN